VELIKRNTRRYAKRQITWFKRNTDIHWIEADNLSSVEIAEQVFNYSDWSKQNPD